MLIDGIDDWASSPGLFAHSFYGHPHQLLIIFQAKSKRRMEEHPTNLEHVHRHDDENKLMMENINHSDNDGSVSGTSHQDTSTNNTAEQQQQFLQDLGNQETRAVKGLRILLLIVLILSAMVAAFGIYFYISNVEETTFEKNFQSSAHKVLESIGESLERTLKAFDGFAISIVSHARATNQSWPFVTMPDFTIRSAKVLSSSEATYLTVAPLVTQQEREQWELYSMQNDHWVNGSIQLQENYDLFHGLNEYNWGRHPSVYGDFGDIPRNIR